MPAPINPRLLGMTFEPPLIADRREDQEQLHDAIEQADARHQRLVLLLEFEHLTQDAQRRYQRAKENGKQPVKITFADLRHYEWTRHAHHILLQIDDLIYRIK